MSDKPASVIAIDGPAGVGKSTVGTRLAERLGYLFLDSGVLYRAVALAALERGIPVGDEAELRDLAAALNIEIRLPHPHEAHDQRTYTVLLDGQDVTWKLRQPQVEAVVSEVAAWPSVRTEMLPHQRNIAKAGRIVMVGRDIGTVVLPDADLKIYLDAPLDERAERRYKERVARGEHPAFAQVEQEVAHRDELDSHRATAPLRVSTDAVIINTGDLNADEVLNKVLQLVEQAPA